MKRFFVMLLACLMLLSVVPFSVFAEEVDHEHGTEQCPVKEADADHTLENTASYEELDKVQGSCGGYSYTVYQCNACGELFADNFVKTANDSHVWEETPNTAKKPTCTEAGKEADETCSNCGAIKAGEVIPATHNLENGACTECDYVVDPDCEHNTEDLANATLIEAPTCGEAGKMQYICECGEIVVVEIVALGHTNLVHSDEVKADCTNAGVKAHDTCADCGKIFINGEEVTAEDLVIEALGHDMNEAIVIAPTCTTEGLSTATCKKCDYKEEEVLEPEHTLSDAPSVTDPTCTRPGMAYDFCIICGAYANVEVAPALGHTAPEDWTHGYTDEQIANTPCNEKLTATYTCVTCNTEVEVIVKDAFAHTFSEKYEVATCSTYKKVWDECSVCGAVENERELVEEGFDSTNHNFEWLWINEATCTQDGNKILYCANCKVTEGELVHVPAGHAWVVVNTVDPTCTSFGYTDYECENCDEFDRVFGEILSHNYDEGVYTAATCIDDAYTTYTCEDCGATRKVIHEGTQLDFDWEKLFSSLEEAEEAHANGVFTVVTVLSGDCLNKGMIIYNCSNCGKNVLVVEEGTGEGHTRPEGRFNCEDAYKCTKCGELVEGGEHDVVVDVEPTCTKDGKGHCSVCEAKLYVYKHGVPAKDMFNAVMPGKAPTCTEDGYTDYTVCGGCGEILVEAKVIPATGHNYAIKINALSFVADCEIDGYNFMECACGARLITDYVFASGHWYIDGETEVELVPDCNAECVCGQEVCVCRVCSFCEALIEKHTFAEPNEVAPTCTKEGYIITVCTACGYYIIDEESIVEPNGHNIVAVEGSIPATYKPGYIYGECSDCGLVTEEAVEAEFDMGLTIEIDNAVVAGAGFSDSSLVAVKINLNSIKEVGVWSINFNLNYNSDKFTYVDAEFVSEAFNGFCKAVDNGTFVAIAATTANDENKQLVDAIINAEDEAFVVVYFLVNDQIADGVTEADVIDNPFAIDATFALNAATEEVTVWGQTETEIAIEKFMDYNKDGVVNAVDYKYAWEIISGTIEVTYDVTLDVDKDGQILENDFFAIFSYILGDADYAYEVLVDRA